ncbi:GNAT family N-acetyltransferase [Bacillus sp. DJP31]|uniref:GNAT family N-acetyltransferase n=1 Tax=Bacillus sp. DJP31 TaxID=3409789 RepID=UPI003BB758DD
MNLLTVVNHPAALLEKAESMLLVNEAKNNLMLGLLYQAHKAETGLENYFFAYAELEDEMRMAFIKTPNKNLIIASGGPISEEFLEDVIAELLQLNLSIPGIVGERTLANDFATVWTKKTGKKLVVDVEQLIYQLDVVNEERIGSGVMRLAGVQDLDTISQWIYDFAKVTPDLLTPEVARQKAEDDVNSQTIYLWTLNNSVVSMAKEARPTNNGVVVTLVFTPEEYRGMGYASSLVASLSKHLLEEGYKFCSLYTDLANPTSNHIYREIGYYQISESIMYSFK